jgi:serine/threonine-protein kinase
MSSTVSDKYEILESLHASVGDFGGPAFKARERTRVEDGNAPSGRIVLLRRLPDGSDIAYAKESVEICRAISKHPGVLSIYEIVQFGAGGSVPSGFYVVSEYERGISLKERIKRLAPFSPATTINIALAIAEALDYAHQNDIEHGALSPEQILLTHEGQVKVADFSFAQTIRETPVEDSRMFGGDIRALGLTLFEMLVGSIPSAAYAGGSYSPKAANAAVPTALDGITRKAMSVDPTVKYPSISDLVSDLQTARDDLKAGKPLNWSPMTMTTGRSTNKQSGKLTEAASELRNESTDNAGSSAGSLLLSRINQILFVVVILFIIGGIIAWMTIFTAPSDTTVPNLVGKSFDDAVNVAKGDHFVLKETDHKYSDVWPQNKIMEQDVPANQSIKSGKTVNVTVSDGPPLTAVPDVSQMTQVKAKKVIEGSGLSIGQIQTEFSDSIPKGIVLRQDPAAASMVPHTTFITITVSKGPAPPPQPTGLTASTTVMGEIDLAWDDDSLATSYNVYRDGKKVVSGLAAPGFADTRLGDAQSHSYTVSAVNVNGESAQCAAVSATTISGTAPTVAPPPSATDSTGALGAAPDPSSPQPAATTGSSPRERQFHIHFKLPRHGGAKKVQIEVQDATGTNVVYEETLGAGETVDQHEPGFGNKVIIRIFLDGKLMKQDVH